MNFDANIRPIASFRSGDVTVNGTVLMAVMRKIVPPEFVVLESFPASPTLTRVHQATAMQPSSALILSGNVTASKTALTAVMRIPRPAEIGCVSGTDSGVTTTSVSCGTQCAMDQRTVRMGRMKLNRPV